MANATSWPIHVRCARRSLREGPAWRIRFQLCLPKMSCAAPKPLSSGTAAQSAPALKTCQDGQMRWTNWITLLLALINSLLADRSRLAIENVALRQQITVLKRSVKRAKIEDSDRIFWMLMRRMLTS